MALIAFDWNGTLLNDIPAWTAAYNAALAVVGIAPQPLEVLQDKFDVPTKLAITNFGIDEATYEARQRDLYHAFSSAHHGYPHPAQLRTGAVLTPYALLRAGHTPIVLSNHDQTGLEIALEMHAIRGAFELVSGNDAHGTIIRHATKQDRLSLIMKQLGVSVDQVVIVGDAREEARIARVLGITGIGIAGGCSSRAHMERDGAHHIVDELEDIPPIIERLFPAA